MADPHFRIEPLDGPFGVAVEGLAVETASATEFGALVDLLHKNHVLVLRGQDRPPPEALSG